jgi:HD-like signal output (HDOD) protein
MVNWTSIRQSLIENRTQANLPLRIKLPVLPLSVMKFIRRAEDPKANADEFARIIETNSALTCELLKYINSSATGLSHRVRCIQQAIAILGIESCKLFLMSTSIKQSMKGIESRLIDMETFWVSNLERALFAREVAVLLDADYDLAFAGGMLQDFLLPVITNELYDDYREYFTQQSERPVRLPDFEREHYEWDHAQAGGHIMLGWDFPDNLICCVLLHHHGLKLLRDKQLQNTAVSAVALSALLPDPLGQETDGIEHLYWLDEAWPEFDLITLAERVDERFQEITPVQVKRKSLLERIQASSVLAAR